MQPSGRVEPWSVSLQQAVTKFHCHEGTLDLRKEGCWLRKPERGEECPLGQAALGAPRHQVSTQPWEEAYLSPLAKSP